MLRCSCVNKATKVGILIDEVNEPSHIIIFQTKNTLLIIITVNENFFIKNKLFSLLTFKKIYLAN